MSIPNPIYVTPSTTFVQVNPLQSPYTPVLLNSVTIPGQVVTILDATSSIQAISTPIVVSTLTQGFQDGSFSTLINQPQGFVTAQTLGNNKWTFLNSFPFRNQYLSAGVLNLTTSTLFTALGSTVQEFISSLVVENLVVTGNFVQSTGITLNTNVSSLGTVDFVSSLSVWGNVYLSSALSSIGPVEFASSLTVLGSVYNKSSIVSLSSVFVSTSVFTNHSLSTGSISFQDGLVGTSLEIQQSSMMFAMDVSGGIQVNGSLFAFSTLAIGNNVEAQTVSIAQNALFKSSVSLHQNVTVSSLTSTTKELTSLGPLSIGNLFTVGNALTAYDTITIGDSGYIGDILTIGSTLMASTVQVITLVTNGDASISSFVQISSASVETNFGAGFLYAPQTAFTTMGTASDLAIGQSATLGPAFPGTTGFQVDGSVSSFSNVNMLRAYVSIEGSLSVNQTYYSYIGTPSQSYFSTTDIVLIGGSTITNKLGADTRIGGDLSALGNLFCENVLTISSITLPSSLIANNFTTGYLFVGSEALAKDSILSTVIASTVTVGYIQTPAFAFDLSGNISTLALSTGILSTALYSTQFSSNAQLLVERGMGVGVEPDEANFVCQPIAYFLSSPIYVFSTLSTHIVTVAETITGTFVGDGSQLSNFNYPPNLSSYELYVSSQMLFNSASYFKTSTIETSTMFAYSLLPQSSLQVGSFYIWGNAAGIEYNQGTNCLQTAPESNLLVINDVKIIGEGTMTGPGPLVRRVAINEDLLTSDFTATLGVNNTIAAEAITTNAFLSIDTYSAKALVASTIYGYGGSTIELYSGYGTLYLSSGVISTTRGKFFLQEGDTYDERFNIVQPYQSTLQFNSTLFVNRGISSVGINTQPNFTLDVPTVLTGGITYAGPSSLLTQVNISKSFSTQVYAFMNSNATFSNTIFSSNLVTWQNPEPLFYPIYGSIVDQTFVGSFTTGLSRQATSFYFTSPVFPEENQTEYFFGTRTYPQGGVYGLITTYFRYAGVTQGFSLIFPGSNCPTTIRTMASDGYRFVFTGTYAPGENNYDMFGYAEAPAEDPYSPALTFSFNNIGLFSPVNNRSNGGYSMVYGGLRAPLWMVVGCGSNSSAYKSSDGLNWTSMTTGYDEMRSVISLELPEVGTPIFLTTGGIFSGPVLRNGGVLQTNDLGTTWSTITDILFTGTGLALATNGSRVVVGGEDVFGNTLYSCSIRNGSLSEWTLCTGTLFPQRANAVLWTGSNWVAGGDTGIRKSYDGIDWFNPTTLTSEIFGLGYTSNAALSATIGTSISNMLNFQDSPDLQCQRLLSVATISYYSNALLNLNNACILDEAHNIVVPGPLSKPSPLSGTTFTSTFYAPTAYISSILSTNRVSLGTYSLGVQSV